MKGTFVSLGLVLVGLVHQILSKITTRDHVNFTLGPKDQVSAFMPEMFHLRDAKNPRFEIVSGPGKIYSYNISFTEYDMKRFGITNVHQVIDLGNGAIGILYNHKSFFWVAISKDGKAIGTPKNYTDVNIGVNMTCDDMILNTFNVQPRIIVSCHENDVSAKDAGISSIYELDFATGALISRIIIDQEDDDLYVEVASKLRIINTIQGTERKYYLLFYSQGLTGSAGNKNKFFRICGGIRSGNITCDPKNTFNLQGTNLGFRDIYDIFQYKNVLLFTGIPTSGSSNVTIAACDLDVDGKSFMCHQTKKDTGIQKGFVGIENGYKYIVVDLVTNTTSFCELQGYFDDPNWTHNCHYNSSILAGDGVFIRDVEYDNSAILIEYVHPNFDYWGYCIHLLYTEENSLHFDDMAALAEDRLVSLNGSNESLHINWLTPNFVYIRSTDIPTSTSITVKATDDETPAGVTAVINVKVQSTYIGDVVPDPRFQWPEIDVLENSFYMWPVNGLDIRGNALQYSLNITNVLSNGTEEDYNGAFEQHIYHTAPVDFAFKSDSDFDKQMSSVVVGDGFAIAMNSQNDLVFYHCEYPAIAYVVCTAKARDPGLKQGIKLSTKTNSFKGIGYAYITGPNDAAVYIFDGELVGAINLSDTAPDDVDVFLATGADRREIGVIAVAYNVNQSVVIYTFDLTGVRHISYSKVLTKENTQDGYLCPSKLNGNNGGYLAVTSLCQNEFFPDARVVVFSWPGPQTIIEYPLATNGTLGAPDACYLGASLIINGYDRYTNTTTLYMTDGIIEDPSEEYFGLDEYGLTKNVQVNCVEEYNMFSVVSSNADGTKNLGVFYGHSRGRADKRAHSLISNKKWSSVSSFSARHGMIHVAYNQDGDPFFWVSYLWGPHIFTDISTTKKVDATKSRLFEEKNLKDDATKTLKVKLVAVNPNKVAGTTSTPFTLRSPDQTITVSSIKKGNLQSGTNDLEDYVKITGPVFSAHLTGSNDTHAVRLRSRISPVSIYHRPGGLVYDIVRVVGRSTYAVAVEKDLTIVDWFYDGQFQKSLDGLGFGEFHSFTAVQLDAENDVDVIFFSITEANFPMLYAQVYKKGIRKSGKVGVNRGYGRDLRAVRVNDQTIYLFAQNMLDVVFYQVTVATLQSVELTYIDHLPGLMDFSVVEGTDHVSVVGFGFEGNTLMGWNIANGNPHTIQGPLSITPDHKYRLVSIACKHRNDTHMWCAINTESSFLIEAYIDYQLNAIVEHRHDKFGYFEGFEVDLAGNYIYMFGKTAIQGIFKMAILAWKTKQSGGNGKLWYAIDLPTPPNGVMDIHYQAPFQVIENSMGKNGDAYVVVATLFDDLPIGFFETSTFKIYTEDANADFSKVGIAFQGLATSNLMVKDYFNFPGNGDKHTAWWPFFGLIGLLIAIAIGWFVYVRIKAEKEGVAAESQAEGQYATVGSEDQQKKTLKEDL